MGSTCLLLRLLRYHAQVQGTGRTKRDHKYAQAGQHQEVSMKLRQLRRETPEKEQTRRSNKSEDCMNNSITPNSKRKTHDYSARAIPALQRQHAKRSTQHEEAKQCGGKYRKPWAEHLSYHTPPTHTQTQLTGSKCLNPTNPCNHLRKRCRTPFTPET